MKLPARGVEAMQALDDSDGEIAAVSDDEILASWKMLASLESS